MSMLYLLRMAQVEVYRIAPEALANMPENAILEGDEAHHLARVRRSRVGDKVILIDGMGTACNAEVSSIDKHEVVLKLNQRSAKVKRLMFSMV